MLGTAICSTDFQIETQCGMSLTLEDLKAWAAAAAAAAAAWGMWQAPPTSLLKRGLSWLKLKKDSLEGLPDSIDVVPIGAWQGQGQEGEQTERACTWTSIPCLRCLCAEGLLPCSFAWGDGFTIAAAVSVSGDHVPDSATCDGDQQALLVSS